MSTRQEMENSFEWWITSIPDKIDGLKKRLPESVSSQLDFSIESVDILQEYLLKEYTSVNILQDFNFWDSCASYIGRTYRTNVPMAEWYIELDDETHLFYNRPGLRVVGHVNFIPHSYVTAALDRKKGNFISTIIKNHLRPI